MKEYTKKYYLHTIFTQMRFTRIINIILVTQVLKLSLVQFTLLQSIFMFAQFVSEIPSGILGDMFRNKTVVLSGLLVLTVTPLITMSSMSCSQSVVFPILIAAFILEGVGNALISGADDALFYEGIREDGDEEKYGRIRGNMQLISSITIGLATAIGGSLFLVGHYLPYSMQSLSLSVAIIIILFTKEQKHVEVAESRNKDMELGRFTNILTVFKDMFRSSNILFLFVFTVIITSVINAIFTVLPDYISQLGFNSSANGGVFMIYSFIGGVIATQSYRLGKLKYSSLSIVISVLLTIATGLQLQGNKYIFIIGAGLLYVVLDILDPIVMQMLNLWVTDASRATFISGLSFSISLMTMVINPIIGSVVQQYGTLTTTAVTSMITIAMVGLSYLLIMKTQKKSQ